MKKFSRKFKILITLVSLLLLWLFLAPLLASFLIVEKTLEKADAILVLGGSATYLERTHKAAELFKQGIAPKIFLTNDGMQGGWHPQEKRNPYIYERARWELIANGVPKNAIEVLPEVVEGTQDEAILLTKNAPQNQLKKVLLVTSAYHTRRTLSTFEQVLRDNNESVEIGITSPPTGEQTPPPSIWWLSRRGWQMVGGEYVKIIYYWLFY